MEKNWLEKVIWKENQKKLKAGASMVHSKDSGRSRCLACPSISSGRTNFKNKRLKASVHTGYFMRCACHQALVATWKQEQRLVVSSMRYEFLRASKENFWKPRQDQLSGFSEHPCRANRSAAIAECVTRGFEGLVTPICRANRSCAIVRTGLWAPLFLKNTQINCIFSPRNKWNYRPLKYNYTEWFVRILISWLILKCLWKLGRISSSLSITQPTDDARRKFVLNVHSISSSW